MFKEIEACRICKSKKLKEILNLGKQYLTGIFPLPGEEINKSPLVLMRCPSCGLVQLKHTYNLEEMYGYGYGYRSSLNSSMVDHLKEVVYNIEKRSNLSDTDIVLDIGSNDGTTLAQYSTGEKIGIDPTAEKFAGHYKPDIKVFPEFFPSKNLSDYLQGRKVKVITSIACFYDLEDPVCFARHIEELLAPDGIWLTEQSYLPSMIRSLAYDTVCHEHLEYYGLQQIKLIADHAGLKIIDVSLNDINGGSFAVTLAKKDSLYKENKNLINTILYFEEKWDNEAVFKEFKQKVVSHRNKIKIFLEILRGSGYKIAGYGASTKGNVLLQFCGISPELVYCIAEVNIDKFDSVTPGTGLPVLPEGKVKETKPDFFLVLPWHFKENILARHKERDFKFIFPLPEIKVV